MKTLKFKKIDAFTRGISSGNPAGYVFMSDRNYLTEKEMQKMACELKGYVNEIGFVNRVGDEFNLKFFSSECEVSFCGHVTIAIMYDLLRNSRDLISKQEIFINVTAGKLSVFNHLSDEDAVYIMAPDPEFLECDLTPSEVAKVLHVGRSAIDDSRPVKFINGGLKTLLVPINSLAECLNMLPNQESLRLFCLNNGIDIVHVSTKETFCDDCQYRTRVFAPKYGYLEDPATGSGNAAFGYYLINLGLWKENISVEQGPSKFNPNFVKLRKITLNKKENMLFGGCCTTRIQGKYYLHEHDLGE